jgi:hypothetical protein
MRLLFLLLLFFFIRLRIFFRFLESDNEVRVVKSQKDKAFEAMYNSITRIRNAKKTSDWPVIQDEFAKMNKLVEKSRVLTFQSGVPNFYIRVLGELEDHIAAVLKDKESIKKMKPIVSKALNQMKLQVKKHNETYREKIADFRQNPEKYEDIKGEVEEEEEEEESESDKEDDDSSSEGSVLGQRTPAKKAFSLVRSILTMLFVFFFHHILSCRIPMTKIHYLVVKNLKNHPVIVMTVIKS